MEVTRHKSVEEIGQAAWAALQPPDFPFWDYGFLRALEQTQCVGKAAGWIPVYLAAREQGEACGAMVLYLKNHSYGEYIFDWEWARAYAEHGLSYYPKLVSAVPFTPAEGAKCLRRGGVALETVGPALIRDSLRLADELKTSSLHALFIPAEEIPVFEANGFLVRHQFQFQWRNHGYSDFEAFLGALKARKRKQILRERREVAESGVEIQVLTGDALTSQHAALMHGFYLSTIEAHAAIPYLNQAFFEDVFRQMRDKVVFMLASLRGSPVAAALHYRSGHTLFGRYWGATEQVPCLHFELCYYRAIEFAISHGLKVVEAGAQGEHKVPRGFLPQAVYSVHWIRDPRFREAIANFLERERALIQQVTQEGEFSSPYASH